MNRGSLLIKRPYGAGECASIRSMNRLADFPHSARIRTIGPGFFNNMLKEFPVSRASRHLPNGVLLVFHNRQPQGEEGDRRRAREGAKGETAEQERPLKPMPVAVCTSGAEPLRMSGHRYLRPRSVEGTAA